jgi:UDP-glucose 4-epimerase
MKILVAGSAGHLGEALVRTLRSEGHSVIGLDIVASAETDVVGPIIDTRVVHQCMQGVRRAACRNAAQASCGHA